MLFTRVSSREFFGYGLQAVDTVSHEGGLYEKGDICDPASTGKIFYRSLRITVGFPVLINTRPIFYQLSPEMQLAGWSTTNGCCAVIPGRPVYKQHWQEHLIK
ncbi:hypothetical protein OUZ56_014349 [Daphnia magna]|uniref:Uncharacterized protein n=1 Tax=Daphnia magna TaxID=35525 RepID=A0ABR0AJI1_9CRUS|nr:hypothetical protein OUZ56_014349 [Daphnia magna]